MSTKAPVNLVKTWSVIYSGITNGSICGSLGVSVGSQIQVYFGTASQPNESENGVNVFNGTPFYMGSADVMWGRSLTGTSTVRIDTNIITPVGTPIDTALVTQSFIEYNVKRGTQFEASSYNATLANGANQDVIFTTGSKPVVIKIRDIQFDANNLTLNLYRGPTFTGGTPITPYNMTDINGSASTVTLLGSPTVTVVGVQEAATRVFVGGTPGLLGVNRTPQGTVVGLERVLAPNTTYLSRISNSSGSVQQVSSYTSWYEGALS